MKTYLKTALAAFAGFVLAFAVWSGAGKLWNLGQIMVQDHQLVRALAQIEQQRQTSAAKAP